MNPRRFLKNLVARLEDPIYAVGAASHGYFSAWEGQEAKLQKRTAGGKGHLAQALVLARQHLAGNTSKKIKTHAIALICASLEREGLKRRPVQSRINGGKKRGKVVRQTAKAAWLKYTHQFEELGSSEKARKTVLAQMRRDGFRLPNTATFPGSKTIRLWLPIRKAE